jgi:hypothetical protein
MSVLRELVARLGFQVDAGSMRKAEAAVDKVKNGLSRLGQVAALAGVGVGLQKIVKLASDANETSNVLEQVFGPDGAKQVKDWATVVGQEVGRSQFQLREFSGVLGAMLDPMLGSSSAAQQMSTTLAKLAVDLGSFFNATDEEALMALRAGITGETEPLRRFGVVMVDATLQEFARTKGIHKSVAAMNVAEKTQLRYQFILAHTAKAQGDAARTGDSYANATKRLKAGLRDIGTEMGMAVLPTIERVINWTSDAIRRFKEWTEGTSALKSAMFVMGLAAVAIGASMLAPFLLPAAAVLALILLVDELHSLFTGGKSVIGHYIDAVLGIGTTDELIRNHKAGVELLAEAWHNLWNAAGEGGENLTSHLGLLEQLQAAGQRVADTYARMGTAIADFFHNLPVIGGAANGKQRAAFSSERATGRGVNAPLMTTEEKARQELRERNAAAAAGRGSKLEFGTMGRATGRGVGAGVERIEFGKASASAAYGSPAVTAPVAGQAGQQVSVNNGPTNLTFNVNGGNLAEVKRVVQEALAADRRRKSAAVPQPGGT